MRHKYKTILMKDFFYAIQDLFVDFLFIPYDALRDLELENWWGANTVSWIFVIVGFTAFIYTLVNVTRWGNLNNKT